jgi:two-component system phosphate regulon sensor histidine kinase PhoR
VGIRGKLFVASLLVIVLVGGTSGFVLERELRTWYLERTREALEVEARTVREAVQEAGLKDVEGASLQALAHRLGEASRHRITFIDPTGRVVADSELRASELAGVENHADRPEVAAALEGRFEMARRRSTTVNMELMYAALPVPPDDPNMVLRLAVPLTDVQRVLDRLRWLLVLAGLVGTVVAVGMSLLASHLMSRALRRLVEHAHSLADGGGEKTRIDIVSSDEIGYLAGSFNQLADELEKTLATLASERNRFETVLQSMSEAVLVLDAEGRITLVNAASLELLNQTESPIGQTLVEAVKIPALAQLAEQGRTGSASVEFSIADGGSRRVLGRATPLQASGGTVVVMHDVTEMRRLETIRKDFVANVSHELRTPVSIIRANAETLLDGALEDPDRARSFVEALHRNSERLTRIIADLLDLSRIEAGRYQYELGPVSLGEAASRAVEAVEPKAEARRIRLSTRMADNLIVWADSKALDQVLLNLLDNSIKYTPEGGHVAVRAESRDGVVKIEVQDDGPGIKPEHRARIFERFYRIDPGRSRDMGGTGLGLAIVKHFVESMRGRVGVEPAFPRGSIFWITLPLAADALREGPAGEDAPIDTRSPAEA